MIAIRVCDDSERHKEAVVQVVIYASSNSASSSSVTMFSSFFEIRVFRCILASNAGSSNMAGFGASGVSAGIT